MMVAVCCLLFVVLSFAGCLLLFACCVAFVVYRVSCVVVNCVVLGV